MKYGMGRHVGTISLEELVMYTKVSYIPPLRIELSSLQL